MIQSQTWTIDIVSSLSCACAGLPLPLFAPTSLRFPLAFTALGQLLIGAPLRQRADFLPLLHIQIAPIGSQPHHLSPRSPRSLHPRTYICSAFSYAQSTQ
jgi:hypothetical protein